MQRIIVLLLVVLIVFIIYIHFSGEKHYLWSCQNTAYNRKGNAFHPENCYTPCEKYQRNAICCEFHKLCDVQHKKEDYLCNGEQRPIECVK